MRLRTSRLKISNQRIVPGRLARLGLAALLTAFAMAGCARTQGAQTIEAASHEPAKKSDPRACVNINTATAKQLVELPGLGEATARKVIEYRERHGPFRRPEQIIIIEGFSERRYKAIAGSICAE